jgi:c-di-GMP-binding flagellar brake protein YcgR
MGVPPAQIMMFQATMRAIKQLEDKLDEVLKSVGSSTDDQKKLNKAMCVDLSSGGMRMITAQKVKRGTLLRLVLTLPPLHPVVVVAVGKIVKASPLRLSSGKRALETAIAFEVINENDREEIIAYSFKRQRQEAARVSASSDEDDDY